MLLNPDTPHNIGAPHIRAVIFDWAGTTVDFGSMAPVRTLERVFGEFCVPILEEEARRDMGIAKRDHIAAILEIPRVRQAWEKMRQREVLPADVDVLYDRFIPLQLDCLKQYSQVIAGVPELAAFLRHRGLKIGSTTGYTRAMLDLLIAEAEKQGYLPDCSLSPEEVGAGRPHPYMIYAAAVQMQVYPMASLVKIGDTVSDIQEGLNAGVWSVGVAGSGNSPREALQIAGAHYVIDSLAEFPAILQDIDSRLARKPA
jgi:phosphonoacetaldehyde hydrolase